MTWLREAQAYGVWFTAFEFMMNQDAKRNGIERKEVPTWKIALYGGLAGEALWLASYPFDVVKSKMQSDGFGAQQKYSSMRDTFAKTWRAEGMRGFWRGLGPTLLRAMPVSAGTFATYVFADDEFQRFYLLTWRQGRVDDAFDQLENVDYVSTKVLFINFHVKSHDDKKCGSSIAKNWYNTRTCMAYKSRRIFVHAWENQRTPR